MIGYYQIMLEQLIALDERVFSFLHGWAAAMPIVWKWLAILGVYLIPLVLVWYWLTRRREPALFAFLTGLFAWFGINNILASLIDRARPIPTIDLHFPAREFLFDRPGPSFPSDHAAFMVAVTTSFFLAGERRIGWTLALITAATTLARVVTAQHWPLDIVAGVMVGVSAVLLLALVRRSIDRWVINPIVMFARRIGF